MLVLVNLRPSRGLSSPAEPVCFHEPRGSRDEEGSREIDNTTDQGPMSNSHCEVAECTQIRVPPRQLLLTATVVTLVRGEYKSQPPGKEQAWETRVARKIRKRTSSSS